MPNSNLSRLSPGVEDLGSTSGEWIQHLKSWEVVWGHFEKLTCRKFEKLSSWTSWAVEKLNSWKDEHVDKLKCWKIKMESWTCWTNWILKIWKCCFCVLIRYCSSCYYYYYDYYYYCRYYSTSTTTVVCCFALRSRSTLSKLHFGTSPSPSPLQNHVTDRHNQEVHRGQGLITPDNGSKDVLIHIKQCNGVTRLEVDEE